MFSLAEEYKAFSLIRPKTITATETGTGIDLGPDYQDDLMAIFNLGAASDTDATCTVTIEGSDAVGGTYTVLATFSTASATDDNKLGACQVISHGASKRFIRAKATVTGTGSPSFALSVILLAKAAVGSSSLNSTTIA